MKWSVIYYLHMSLGQECIQILLDRCMQNFQGYFCIARCHKAACSMHTHQCL